jgi:NCAIR mutase (PurE)-related protein
MRIRPLAIPSLTLAVMLLHSATAQAATLHTPAVHLNADQQIRVQVTNLGTKDIDVTVTLKNFAGTPQVPFADECAENAPLEPGSTCRVFYSTGVAGFATVEPSSGKVRAAINVLDTASGAVVTVVPATTK